MKKPITGNAPSAKNPVISNKVGDQQNWSFSFKYFKQHEYFGLEGLTPKWFISVLDRLRDLCKQEVDSFFTNRLTSGANRFHKINWNATNIPIRRSDITWVDKSIIDNDEEFPFFQFQISLGLGRVIGFWSEESRFFYIVLLDPKHNMQPSKKYDYRVDDTRIEFCEFTSLLMDIDNLKRAKCIDENCSYREKIELLPTSLNRGSFVYFQIDDEYYPEFIEKTKGRSIKEIIELGLLSI